MVGPVIAQFLPVNTVKVRNESRAWLRSITTTTTTAKLIAFRMIFYSVLFLYIDTLIASAG